MPKNIYDRHGRKIGEVRDAGEEAAGMVLFLYLLWKALPGLIVLGLIGLLIAGGIWVWNAGARLIQYGTVNEQEAQARARSTQVAEENAMLLVNAQHAIESEDYYVAAAILGNVIRSQPDNQQARTLLNQISSYVPGGLVVGGHNGVYYPFNSADQITFIDGLYGELVGVSPDGQRALIAEESAITRWALLALDSGEFIGLGEYPDRSLRYVARGNNLIDIFNGENIVVQCWDSYWGGDFDGLWSNDGRWLADAGEEVVEIIDLQTGTCQNVPVPGLRYALALTDGSQIWIILSGSSTSLRNARLLALDLSGNNIRELGEIEGIYEPEVVLLSPDSSALYVGDEYFGSKIISTRTGLQANGIGGAIAWLSNAPLVVHIPPPALEINPPTIRVGDPVNIEFWGVNQE